jgi:hypothetical protein
MLGDVPVSYLREDKQTMTDAINRALFPSEVAGKTAFVRDIDRLLAETHTPAVDSAVRPPDGSSRATRAPLLPASLAGGRLRLAGRVFSSSAIPRTSRCGNSVTRRIGRTSMAWIVAG